MVSGKETKAASLVLTAVIAVLLLLPIDVKAAGMSQGCSLWQRLCYPFLHGSILHAAVNCWCLLSIVFNRTITVWQMIAAYAIAVSYPSVWMGQTVTVGLSGMLFALLGTISVMSRKWYLNVAVIGSVILFGYLFPNINASLHLYCYIVGLAVGFINKPVQWTI